MSKDNIQAMLDIIEKSADARGGADIQTLDIRDMTAIADYFVIISGGSTPKKWKTKWPRRATTPTITKATASPAGLFWITAT